MGFIRFIVWTACSVAFGVYVSTAKYDGGTPLEQMERVWRRHGPSTTEVTENVRGVLETARGTVAAPKAPTERHTTEEREAVNRLIAGRGGAK